jgi:hypothetical protein
VELFSHNNVGGLFCKVSCFESLLPYFCRTNSQFPVYQGFICNGDVHQEVVLKKGFLSITRLIEILLLYSGIMEKAQLDDFLATTTASGIFSLSCK